MTARFLGAALVAAAGVWSGLLLSAGLRDNLARRESLSRMLELMSYELARFRTPLPELFAGLSEQLDGAAAGLCRDVWTGLSGGLSFSRVWSRAIQGLSRREREVLAPLGTVLGRYDAEEQAAAIDGARRRMEALCRESGAELREKSRVRVGVSAAAGAILAVLLI